jgi:hypothetical protein
MERLNLNSSDLRTQQLLQPQLLKRISQIHKRLATRDVVNYILLIVIEMNKTKSEVREDLDEFFESKTVEFVNWIWSTLPRLAQEVPKSSTDGSKAHESFKPGKKRRCRDWPECERGEKCEFFHPSVEVLTM